MTTETRIIWVANINPDKAGEGTGELICSSNLRTMNLVFHLTLVRPLGEHDVPRLKKQ